MLNGSRRGFSNFYDRLAVQRSLAERLLREVVQHWLQQRRLWGTCRFHSFRGVCRDTILCGLSTFGALVLVSLRNGDFKKLCKIQLGILTYCCLHALWVRRLSDDHHLLSSTCFAASFWLPHNVESVSGSVANPTSPQHSLRLSSRALQPKWRERNHRKALCNDFGSWTPNWPVSNSASSSSSVSNLMSRRA